MKQKVQGLNIMSISYEVGLGLGLPTFAATPTKSSYNDDISATAKAVLAQAGGPNKPDVFKKKQPQIRIVAQPAVQPAGRWPKWRRRAGPRARGRFERCAWMSDWVGSDEC